MPLPLPNFFATPPPDDSAGPPSPGAGIAFATPPPAGLPNFFAGAAPPRAPIGPPAPAPPAGWHAPMMAGPGAPMKPLDLTRPAPTLADVAMEQKQAGLGPLGGNNKLVALALSQAQAQREASASQPGDSAKLPASPEAAAASPRQLASVIGGGGSVAQSALAKAIEKNRAATEASLQTDKGTMAKAGADDALAEQKKGEAMAQQATDLAKWQGDQNAAKAKYDSDHAAQVSNIAAAQKDLAASHVDPDHWMGSRSTGQKIALVLGAALGGALQGMKGGSNVALDTIERNIDRDIQVQQFGLNQKRAGISDQKDLLGIMDKYGIDQQNAGLVQKGLMLEATKSKLDQITQGQKSADVLKQTELMKTDIDRRIAGLNLQATISSQPKPVAGVAAAKPSSAFDHAYYEEQAANDARYVPYGGGLAGSEKQANELNAAAAAYEAVKADVATIKATRARRGAVGLAADKVYNMLPGGAALESKEHAELGAIGGRFVANVAKIQGGGSNLTENEIERTGKQIGNPTDVFGQTDAKLDSIVEASKRALDEHVKASGISKGNKRYITDENQVKHPFFQHTGETSAAPNAPAPRGFKPADGR